MSTAAPAAVCAAPAALDVPTMPIYRLGVAQYHAMIRHGILTENDRVELIHGWLVPKMTKHPPHTVANTLLRDALQDVLPPDLQFRSQDPGTHTSMQL